MDCAKAYFGYIQDICFMVTTELSLPISEYDTEKLTEGSKW